MKKRIVLFLLFIPICLFAQQQEVFRIDSLPKEGVLLNQGWKWHAGDNPEWAKVEFDDAGWEDIDPTKDIFDLPQLSKSGEIGWFRIHLWIDSSLMQQIVMQIQQSGASEIYLSGKLVHHFGTLSTKHQKVKAFNPLLKPVAFPISNKHIEVLAVRYALQPDVWYTSHFGRTNQALAISLNTVENGVDIYDNYRTLFQRHPIRAGIFFSLAILYFAFYFFYRKRVVNLYFSIYVLLHAISWKINYWAGHTNQVALFFIQNNATVILQVLGYLIMLNAIYQFLEQKRRWHYWALIVLGVISIPLSDLVYHWGWLIYGILFINLIHVELARVSIIASRRNKKGAWIIATGCILALLCWLIFSLQWFFPFTILGIDFFDLNFICVPISVSIYLGYDVAITNRSLAQKLIEVETLSAEKQLILSTQNETLEHQVSERTAELSSKNRELEIEAALERVRSRTMAMQRSSELADCTQVLFHQIQGLALPFFTCGFLFIDESLNLQRGWTVSPDGTLIPDFIDFPLTGDEVLDQRYENWKQNKPLHVADLQGEANKEHHRFLASKVPSSFSDEIIAHLPERIIFYSANFSQGIILILATEFMKREEEQILIRFAKVFEQTYTRFLDLQKAEAQAEQARLNLIQIQMEKKRAEEALIALKQTQIQLIQSEKLASLGELTAGIAHEIQNPLNFVNNFAEVSAEMIGEMKDELKAGNTSEAIDIADDLEQNLNKIKHHGQRASSIVKGMLEHSRASTGVKELTDINKLADEYLRLAYHGLRANDKDFNANYALNVDEHLPKIEVVPQDIGRVLLNLINNAFYAVNEKSKQGIEGYQPKVTVSARKLEKTIEISVQDNGNGIPEAIKDKIFQPFFTTKPTGQGTGLGLSLAYDIVVKGHGGTLEVDSKEGIGTEFIIQLPI